MLNHQLMTSRQRVLALFPLAMLIAKLGLVSNTLGQVNAKAPKKAAAVQVQQAEKPTGTQAEGDAKRIQQLEARINRLERIVFATSKLTVLEAERQLAEARQRLKNSERLFARGLLAEFAVTQDRYQLRMAEQELSLAKADQGERKLAMEIDLTRAQQNVATAREQLAYTKRLADRGYVSLATLEKEKREVTVAEKQLEIAQMRLKAISKPSQDRDNEKSK